jgi:hypothetical protein
MAIASGLTSAITNPLAAEVKAAIMAADVLMGNDQDAGRWIRAHREAAHAPAAPARPAAPGAPARVAAAADAGPTPLSVIEGGSSDARPPGNRPRINRRALAAAAAMRDAAGGSSGPRT